MPLILDIPSSVERERSVNAVRSSLSPEKRFAEDRSGYKREHQRAIFADSEAKKKAALQPDNGQERNHDWCIGMPLHSDVFMRRLLQLNPNLWFEQSNADHERVGIYLIVPISMEYPEGKRHLMGFHHGIMPEFFLPKHPGDDGENIGILRQGYRTILARLIRMRLISLPAAEVLFGQPSHESAYWAALTGKRNSL